jgi:hypothetical protein
LLLWLQELLSGPYDQDYVVRRWQAVECHIEMGLEQTHFGTAMARLRSF